MFAAAYTLLAAKLNLNKKANLGSIDGIRE